MARARIFARELVGGILANIWKNGTFTSILYLSMFDVLRGNVNKAEEWPLLPVEISLALANTHTTRVIEENPLTFDTALRELLNRFGLSG